MAVRTQAELQAEIALKVQDNAAQDITAAEVRSVLTDLNDSKEQEGGTAAAITEHSEAATSHLDAIDSRIRQHSRGAIPNADPTHQEIRDAVVLNTQRIAEHTASPHGGITLEQARDAIAGILTEGANIGIVYDDAGAGAGTITITGQAGAAGLTTEQVRDLIGTVLIPGANVTIDVDDDADTVTINTVPGEGGGLTVAQVLAVVVDWAEQDNTDLIPVAKLPEATTGAAGAVELSTNTEAEDSANNVVVIRPNNLHHVLDAHIAVAGAHQTLPAELPTATQVQAQAASGTTRLIWTVTRLRELVTAALATISNADAIAGTSTARRVWTALRVRQAINAVVHSWARTGNTDTIPANKLPGATVAQAGISEFADIDELDAQSSTTHGVSVAGLAHVLSSLEAGGGDPLTLGALPALGDLHNARLYGEQETEGEPPDGVWYKKRSMGNEIRVRIDDISSRVPNTIYRAFGWSTVTLAEHYREGGAIYPAKPPALSAVLREYNTETFMWKWVVVTTDAAPFIHTSITLVALNDNGTTRGSTLATEITAGIFESVERTTTAEDAAMGGINVHETVPFLIRQGGEANTYPLTTENHRARLLDNEDIVNIEGAAHEEVEVLRGHIEPWALTYGDAGQTPGMLEIGGFTQAEIDAIPAGGSADFLYRGRVLKDPDGTLAYVGGGWQERNGALGFVYVTQAEYDALPGTKTSDGKHYYISV